ncbi:MAG: OmpH family outer membrane protein [Planctomycetota bacterium]
MTHTSNRPGVITLAVATALVLAGWLAGQSATATNRVVMAPPTSVAVIRLEPLLEQLKERTELEDTLNAFIAERQAQVDALRSEGETAASDLELFTPGTAAHRDKTREVLEIRAALETRQKILQEIVSVETGTILQELYLKIKAAAQRIAVRDGYDIILLDDSAANLPPNVSEGAVLRFIGDRRVLYANDAVDVTGTVANYMNNAFAAGRN